MSIKNVSTILLQTAPAYGVGTYQNDYVEIRWEYNGDATAANIYRIADGVETSLGQQLGPTFRDPIPYNEATQTPVWNSVQYYLIGVTTSNVIFSIVLDPWAFAVREMRVTEETSRFWGYFSTQGTRYGYQIYRIVNNGTPLALTQSQYGDFEDLKGSWLTTSAKTLQYMAVYVGLDAPQGATAYSAILSLNLPIITVPTTVPRGGTINISWEYDVPETTFYVDRRVNSGAWTNVATGISYTTFSESVNSGWAVGASVEYRVRARLHDTYTDYAISSITRIVYATPALTVPASVMATDSFEITWSDINSGATYIVERKTGSSWVVLSTTVTSKSYTDTAQGSWATAQYRVKAGGPYASDYSNISVVEIRPFVPTIPTVTVSAVPELKVGNSYSVFWDSPTANITYDVERSTDGGTTYVRVYTSTPLEYYSNVAGLWTSLRYRARAYDGVNYSSWGYTPLMAVAQPNFKMAVKIGNDARVAVKMWIRTADALKEVSSVWVKIGEGLKKI